MSLFLPLAWTEVSGGFAKASAVHAILGWLFALVPLFCVFHLLLKAFRYWSLRKVLKNALLAIYLAAFFASAAWSIRWLAEPSYIYLIPGHEIINAQRRAFFVRSVGNHPPREANIAIRDDKAGTVQDEKYSVVDPQKPNSDVPVHYWVTPSSPWDEDYTVTVTYPSSPSTTQRMVLRSTRHLLQLAVEVTADGESSPLLKCRDPLMPVPYTLASGASESCGKWMPETINWEGKLEPAPYNLAMPDGSLLVLRPRVLAPEGQLESQSEKRHLWEWQKAALTTQIAKFRGSRVLILSSRGAEAWSYANDFRDTFKSAGWTVEGPKAAPQDEGTMIDVQESAGTSKPVAPEVLAVRDALANARLKRRNGFVYDPDVPKGLIVIWVGANSPEGITAGDCAPFTLRVQKGSSKPCEMISQTPNAVPLPPP